MKYLGTPFQTPQIADMAVTTAKLDDDAVTTPKIAAAAVTSAKTGQFAGFSIYRGASVSYVSGSTIQYDTNDVAPRGCSLSAGRVTFTEAGTYVVTAKVEFAGAFPVNSFSYLELYLQRPPGANTLVRRGGQFTATGAAVVPMIDMSAIVPVQVGDLIEIHCAFSIGGPLTMSGGVASTSFSAFKVGA